MQQLVVVLTRLKPVEFSEPKQSAEKSEIADSGQDSFPTYSRFGQVFG
jgi:hypothetical protein